MRANKSKWKNGVQIRKVMSILAAIPYINCISLLHLGLTKHSVVSIACAIAYSIIYCLLSTQSIYAVPFVWFVVIIHYTVGYHVTKRRYICTDVSSVSKYAEPTIQSKSELIVVDDVSEVLCEAELRNQRLQGLHQQNGIALDNTVENAYSGTTSFTLETSNAVEATSDYVISENEDQYSADKYDYDSVVHDINLEKESPEAFESTLILDKSDICSMPLDESNDENNSVHDSIHSEQKWIDNLIPEPEMRVREYCKTNESEPRGELEDFVNEVYATQPVLGNINIDAERENAIYNYARSILMEAHNNGANLSDIQCDVLTLETILLLRAWNDINYDGNTTINEEKPKFWEFICNQYAVQYDVGAFIKNAMCRSLSHHNRLIAKSGTKKYYTSLLTHAMSPKSKFFLLFEQVYFFYARTLQYQFIEDDTSFFDFAYEMKRRFDGTALSSDEDIYIKSLQSSSAIKNLFSTCPVYMGHIVKEIVHGIDLLIAQSDYTESTYIASILREWYSRRNREIRTHDREEQQKALSNRVETDFRRITISYQLKNGKVYLCIPSIRMGEQSEQLPEIRILNNDKLIYTESLKWYGERFCITSVRTEIDLDRINNNNTQNFTIEAVITNGGDVVYTSNERLFRDAIVFSEKGSEITKRPVDGELFHLYTTMPAIIDNRLYNSPQCIAIPSNAKLYRLIMGSDTQVIINGINLFPSTVNSGELCVKIMTSRVESVHYVQDGHEYDIFAEIPELTLSTLEKNIKQYSLFVDGQQQPLMQYENTQGDTWSVCLPGNDTPHLLQLIDNLRNTVVYSLRYVVFERFALTFKGFISLLDSSSCEVFISDIHDDAQYKSITDMSETHLCVPFRNGELRLESPTLSCRLDGEILTKERPSKMWCGRIPVSAVLEVEPPKGYLTRFQVGNHTYDSISIEVGNLIRTVKFDGESIPINIVITKDDFIYREIKISEVVLKASFDHSPLVIEEGKLLWCVERNYYGENGLGFEVRLFDHGYVAAEYHLGYNDMIIEQPHQFSDGVYEYSVTSQTGLFSLPETIYKGKMIVGDMEALRFYKQAVVVSEAIIEDERIALNGASGVLTQLEFKGIAPLNGEDIPYPLYEGCLQYYYNGELRPYASHSYVGKRDGAQREQVNPVKLWVVNDHTISLRDPDNDGLYINRIWKSITDRVPDKFSRSNYENADYYQYIIKSEDEYVQPN